MDAEDRVRYWTVNAIKDAVRATATHRTDPDTMRLFKAHIGKYVYQGQGGVFFIISEATPCRQRTYAVAKFDPATSSVAPVGDLQSFSTRSEAQHQAWRLASRGGSLIITSGDHEESKQSSQLLADLHAHGCSKATPYLVDRLVALAREHREMMEDRSNGATIYGANGALLPPLDSIQSRLEHIATSIGVVGVDVRSDPVGSRVRLRLADGATCDLGREGGCVPQSSLHVTDKTR